MLNWRRHIGCAHEERHAGHDVDEPHDRDGCGRALRRVRIPLRAAGSARAGWSWNCPKRAGPRPRPHGSSAFVHARAIRRIEAVAAGEFVSHAARAERPSDLVDALTDVLNGPAVGGVSNLLVGTGASASSRYARDSGVRRAARADRPIFPHPARASTHIDLQTVEIEAVSSGTGLARANISLFVSAAPGRRSRRAAPRPPSQHPNELARRGRIPPPACGSASSCCEQHPDFGRPPCRAGRRANRGARRSPAGGPCPVDRVRRRCIGRSRRSVTASRDRAAGNRSADSVRCNIGTGGWPPSYPFPWH